MGTAPAVDEPDQPPPRPAGPLHPVPWPPRRALASLPVPTRRRLRLAAFVVVALVVATTNARLRADAATRRAQWVTADGVAVLRVARPAGTVLDEADIVRIGLPPAAVPTDAAADPVGSRIRDDLPAGVVVRDADLVDPDRSALGARIGPGQGLVALEADAPHLRVGDRVDLFDRLTGRPVGTGARVAAMVDDRPIVEVARTEIPELVRSLDVDGIVAVLTG